MSKADRHVELAVLEGNLASGTCVGRPASALQEAIRVRRIGDLRASLKPRQAVPA